MKDKRIKILSMIAADMESDAKYFDGKEFNGKNVAAYFGNQGAAITTLANIIKSILENSDQKVLLEECAKIAEKYEPDEKLDYVAYASREIRLRKGN